MLTRLIFDWARRTPDRPAAIRNGQVWSYLSFAQQIALARSYFARRGYAGSGYAVLVVQDLMQFWIVSLALRSLGLTTVAVANAGALEDLGLPGVRCVVTVPGENWPMLPKLCTERNWPLLQVTLSEESAAAAPAPEKPGGHILLTSGTTGSPKMVLMTPETDAVFLTRNIELFGMNQNSIFSVFDFPPWTAAGYRFGASPWLAGGTTLIDQGPEAFRPLLHPGITHAGVTPSLLDAVLAAPEDAFARNDTLQLICTAGAVTRDAAERAKARITPNVYNLLSSTEGSGVAFTRLETPEDFRWQKLVPGRAIEIVDEFDRSAALGETGKLRVSTEGGPGEYLHNQEATRNFFKDGFFYPGDLAVLRSDGRIALQGRATDVLNIRGDKILPAPIEERLREALGVSGVCVFSRPDEGGEEEICIIVESPQQIEPERLEAAIQRECKGFPHARVYHTMSLPRNPMGKLLRHAVRGRFAQKDLAAGQNAGGQSKQSRH